MTAVTEHLEEKPRSVYDEWAAALPGDHVVRGRGPRDQRAVGIYESRLLEMEEIASFFTTIDDESLLSCFPVMIAQAHMLNPRYTARDLLRACLVVAERLHWKTRSGPDNPARKKSVPVSPTPRTRARLDAITRTLRDADEPLTARAIARRTNIVYGPVTTLLRHGEASGLFRQCGRSLTARGNAPSILWTLANPEVRS